MKYINCKYEGAYFDFSGLVVATYIESSDTYKIYRYQLDGLNSVTLQDDIKTGHGKVSKVMYVAGSSWEWASDLSLYN